MLECELNVSDLKQRVIDYPQPKTIDEKVKDIEFDKNIAEKNFARILIKSSLYQRGRMYTNQH